MRARRHHPGPINWAKPLAVTVSGAKLLDQNGKTLHLHGGDISQPEDAFTGSEFFKKDPGGVSSASNAALEGMLAWHINCVRVPLNEGRWLGINGAGPAAEYQEAILDLVKRANAKGIYVILDDHKAAPGSRPATDAEGWFDMPNKDHSPAFWTSVATMFKPYPAVIFDLFNEPDPGETFPADWELLRDGGSYTTRHMWRDFGGVTPEGKTATVTYEAAGMQELLNAVRATGATNPVMVAGRAKAAVVGSSWVTYKPTDSANQMAASYHNYEASKEEYENATLPVLAGGNPVITGEIGEFDCAHGFIDPYMTFADAHGVSYCAWAWYPWAAGCSSFPALIGDSAGTEPTAFGLGYKEHLLATYPAVPVP
jgi:hypothetical protein